MNFQQTYLMNFISNPWTIISNLPTSFCSDLPEGPISYLPCHLSLFFSFVFIVSTYGYSVLHDANVLCIGWASVGILLVSIFSLASMFCTIMLVIWSFRISSKNCLRAISIAVLIFSVVAFASILCTALYWDDSGMMLRNENVSIYKCYTASFTDTLSKQYKFLTGAYQVLLDYNATQMIGANNTCVFRQIDDICGIYGSFRQSTELQDKQEVWGAHICSKNDVIGASLCLRYSKMLRSYMSPIMLIGIVLNLCLASSTFYFLENWRY